MANSIQTGEQEKLIQTILHKSPREMSHQQYGEILTLADEIGRFDEYVQKAGGVLSYDDAELLKDELIDKILAKKG